VAGGFIAARVGGSKYQFAANEVQNIIPKAKGSPNLVTITGPSGELMATLDLSSRLATAGPKGMYLGFGPMSEVGNLNLGKGLSYQVGTGKARPASRSGKQ
jgi:hypothetical protein